VTEGGTQPVRDVFVDPPSSALGLSGDGKVSSRSTSLEAGPCSAYRPTVCSESADEEHGPAQGATCEENREVMDTVCSDVVRISTTDERLISTIMFFWILPVFEFKCTGGKYMLYADIFKSSYFTKTPLASSLL